jgi:hypothetical protein
MLKKVYAYHVHLAKFTESHFNSLSLYDLLPNTKFDLFPCSSIPAKYSIECSLKLLISSVLLCVCKVLVEC